MPPQRRSPMLQAASPRLPNASATSDYQQCWRVLIYRSRFLLFGGEWPPRSSTAVWLPAPVCSAPQRRPKTLRFQSFYPAFSSRCSPNVPRGRPPCPASRRSLRLRQQCLVSLPTAPPGANFFRHLGSRHPSGYPLLRSSSARRRSCKPAPSVRDRSMAGLVHTGLFLLLAISFSNPLSIVPLLLP